jgi:type I restriction enzyme M protein
LAQLAQEVAEKEMAARRSGNWNGPALRKAMETWGAAHEEAIVTIRETLYFIHQSALLQEHFPEARYADVSGLCKVVTLEEIEAKDASLTPGRFVGVDLSNQINDEEFEEKILEIHTILNELNSEAAVLAQQISKNFMDITSS